MGLKPVSVGQLNNYIGRVLRTDPVLSNVSVIGELSNVKYHSSGHVYFSLKDEAGKVNCFLPSSKVGRILCPLEDGLEVIVSGFISLYERGGYYSLNVNNLEINGSGQLAVEFEKLKAKLGAEGLFRDEHKKEIPSFPHKVAIVTSETGAAVKDIIRTITNKNDYVHIVIYPVAVQGPGAAGEIAVAIDDINSSHSDVNLIITGRGGGSIEELWAFNEEVVARSIFASEIPVISAVGHETDYTIADFVADLRAATPTAAGEAAVPNTAELKDYMDHKIDALHDAMNIRLEGCQKILEALNPDSVKTALLARIGYEQMNLDRMMDFMREKVEGRLERAFQRTEMLLSLLESSSPMSIMARGYSVMRDQDGRIVKRADELSQGQRVNITTSCGNLDAEVIKVNN